jgi:hypothetical protein
MCTCGDQVTSTAASIVQTKSLAKRMHPGGEAANDSSGPQQPARGGEQGPAEGQQQRGGSAASAAAAKSDTRDKNTGQHQATGDTKNLHSAWMGRAPVVAEPHTPDTRQDRELLTPSKGDQKHHESKERGGHESHHKSHHQSASKEKKVEPDTQPQRPRSTAASHGDQSSRKHGEKDHDKHLENHAGKSDGGHGSSRRQSHGDGVAAEHTAPDGDGPVDKQQSTQENHEQKRSQHHNRRRSRHSDEDSDGNDQFWEELISREVQRPVVDVEDDYLEMAVQVRTYAVSWCALLSAAYCSSSGIIIGSNARHCKSCYVCWL